MAKVYILVIHDDYSEYGMTCLCNCNENTIKDAAEEYRSKYDVPLDRCFIIPFDEYKKPKNYVRIYSDTQSVKLNGIDSKSKLIIVGHANQNEIGPFGPIELAEALKKNGLGKVMLVSFKACEIGKGDFLTQFVNGCISQDIKIGYAKGYRGETRTMKSCCLCCGNPHELLGNRFQSFLYSLGSLCCLGSLFACEPCGTRVKIVKGNLNTNYKYKNMNMPENTLDVIKY